MEIAVSGGKIVTKTALNMGFPGLGSAVDFYDAGKDLYNGNYISATLNACTGLYELFTLGLFSAAKEVAKGSAKQASINMAKQACKESKKRIGAEAAKKIAQGAPKKVTAELSKLAADRVKKDLGTRLGKDLASGMLTDVTEEAFKQSSKTVALKTASMSLLESGGKNARDALFEGLVEGICNEYSRGASKILTSQFESTAKTASKAVADDYIKKAVKRDVLFKGGKAIVNCYTSKRE